MSKLVYECLFISDGGHGWLRVKRNTAPLIKILPKVSQYSYIDTDYVYLEEDRDALLFDVEVTARGGIINTTYQDVDGDCFVRNLDRVGQGWGKVG